VQLPGLPVSLVAGKWHGLVTLSGTLWPLYLVAFHTVTCSDASTSHYWTVQTFGTRAI